MTATLHSPCSIGAHGVRDVVLERRATNDGGADERRVDAQILAQRQHRQTALGRGAEQAVDVLQVRPQSSSARWMPCAIRSMTDMPSATWPRSDSATPTIAALARFKTVHHSGLRRHEHGHRRLLAAGTMHAKAHAHGRCLPARSDVLDAAHQPEALVAVDRGPRCRARLLPGCTTVVE